MDTIKPAIGVFCGSSFGSSPRFREIARTAGRLIGENGFSMVFGGGDVGLMGEAARAARAAGAPILGVLPDFLRYAEPPLRSGETIEIVPDFYSRKERMIDRSDAFLVLPGGIGTLDELTEVLTIKNLGRHDKPILLVDEEFFAPLLALFEHYVANDFVSANMMSLLQLFPTSEHAIDSLVQRLLPSSR